MSSLLLFSTLQEAKPRHSQLLTSSFALNVLATSVAAWKEFTKVLLWLMKSYRYAIQSYSHILRQKVSMHRSTDSLLCSQCAHARHHSPKSCSCGTFYLLMVCT